MASLKDCEQALADLAGHLHRLDPDVRRKHIPRRDVSIMVPDLEVAFRARLDDSGVHDERKVSLAEGKKAQVRFTASSDEVVEIGRRPAAFVGAWLRGRVKVHAGWRDLLQLRSLL